MKIRLILAALATAVMTAFGASAASAANQSGLVNVDVSNNTIQVPIGVAANICQVSVNILASATQTAPANCTAVSTATAFSSGGGGGGSSNQQGLINIAIVNNTIQVPIGIAANLCQIAANVLAQQISTGGATCTAVANASARG